MTRVVSPTARREGEYPRSRAVRGLRQWITEGRFSGGELLPSEQALCGELEVSRGTLRIALQQLEDEGLLQRQKGRGRSVSASVARLNEGMPASLMTQTIALVTELTGGPPPQRYGGGLEAIESGAADAVRQAGFHLFSMNSQAFTTAAISRLLEDPPMGVVVGGVVADYSPHREALIQLRPRMRMVVNGNDPLWADCDRVVSDHEAGAYELTRLLLGQGRRRIQRIWSASPHHYWLQARNAGYERAMAEAGIAPMPPVWVKQIHDYDQHTPRGFEMCTRMLAAFLIEKVSPSRQIDAIMATSDSEAYVNAAAVRLFGMLPNEDVAIVGYDNHWTECPERQWESCNPMATVDKLNHQTGEQLVSY